VLGEEYTAVLSLGIPKENESENVVGRAGNDLLTDVTLPKVMLIEVGWTIVLGGE
jgi:hypothetical protein